MRWSESIVLGIIILFLAISFAVYPSLPDQIPSHWNAQGEVNGYMHKFWGLFMLPLISIGLLLLFIAIPKIDPLKRNIEKFREQYDRFVVIIILFFLYIHLLIVFWSLGFAFNMTQAIIPAIAGLFYYIGVLLTHAKRNWFVGIRTPWTLSSEKVWDKTHKRGGKLFKVAGVIALVGIMLPDFGICFILIPVLAVVVYTIAYSYFEYQKE